jgi:hypothetical protein
MKKGIMVLVLAAFIAGGAFAQDVKNWISGEISILGVGARYEYMLNEKFSVGVTSFWNTLIFWNAWGVSAAARYYPFAGAFYLEGDLGYGTVGGIEEGTDSSGSPYSWFYFTKGVMVTPGIGWKIDIGAPGGFFINPMVTFPIVFGKKVYDIGGTSDFKVGIHPRIGFALGGAF